MHAHLRVFCLLGEIIISDKSFKSLEEQIEILKSRGLTVEDDKEAETFLLYNNYYRVSGYLSDDTFTDKAKYEKIMKKPTNKKIKD